MYAVTYYINGFEMRRVFKTKREAIWKADELLEMGFVYGIKITHVDLRRELCEGEVYCWAKDEDGEDVLLCRN